MQTNYQKVREWHKAFGVPCLSRPGTLTDDRAELRYNLIAEEAAEACEAIVTGSDEDIAKELADVLYVVYGTAAEMGFDLDDVFDRVHKSNMSKLGDDGKPIRRGDGKVLKGPNYVPPEITLKGVRNGS